MKFYSILFIFQIVFLSDQFQSYSLGSWEEITFKECRDVLNLCISDANILLTTEANYFKLNKLERAQRHLVNGFMYKFQFSLVETKCLKSVSLSDGKLDVCELSDKKNTVYCEASILEQKWLSPSTKMIKKPKCTSVPDF
jgi:hypothetical protein